MPRQLKRYFLKPYLSVEGGKTLAIKNAAEPTIVDLWLWRVQLFLILVIQFGEQPSCYVK